MKKEKKFKIFSWWVILLIAISILSSLGNIRRCGLENCDINYWFLGGMFLLIAYRTSIKRDIENKDKSNPK